MKGNNGILEERQRIRKIIETKIDSRINWRRKNRQGLGFISHFEKLKDDILFLIDTPDYKRKSPNSPNQSFY